MNPYSIPPAMAAGLTLMLGYFVLCSSPQERLNRLFFIFTCTTFLWLFLFAVGYSMESPFWALFIFRTAYLGIAFGPVACLHFHLEFLGIYKRKLITCLYFISFIFLLLSQTDYFLPTVKKYFWGFYPQAGPLYVPFVVFFLGIVAASSCILVYQLIQGTVKGDVRNFKFRQLKYIAIGFIIIYVGSVDFIAKFGFEFYPFGYLNIMLFVIILTYAILRHKLLDMETMMQLFRQHKLATLGLLAAGLNHEVRNPLFIIKGNAESYLDSLQEEILKNPAQVLEKSKRIFGKTIEQAERAIDVMKRFSTFVRVARNSPVKEEILISDCIRSVLEFLSHEISSKKTIIETYCSNDFKIFANRREIEEIIFNIVLNACQVMGEKGKLTVSALQHLKRCLILIKDTGPGIPKHLRKKVFEPFYSQREGGTGLGLYICQYLTEQNGGQIYIDSKIKEGTVFTLDFPLMEEKNKTEVLHGELSQEEVRKENFDQIKA